MRSGVRRARTNDRPPPTPVDARVTRTDDVSSDGYTDIQLAAAPISDDPPLFSQDLAGDPLPNDVFVLAVDLTTGQIYDDQTNFTLFDTTLSPTLENGHRDGIAAVRLDVGGVRQPYVGNTWRFYYATLNYHNVQLQKPARTFMDIATAECYTGPFLADATLEPGNLAQVDYRTYDVVMEPSAVADMDQTVLEYLGRYPGPGSTQYPSGCIWSRMAAIGPFWCAFLRAMMNSSSVEEALRRSRMAR